MLVLAFDAGWIPAAAADYGPVRDVHDARSALQRQSSAYCAKLLQNWTMKGCLSDQPSVRDVTTVADYAIVSRGELPTVHQTLLIRRDHDWRYRADSGGEGFALAELIAHGVPQEIAARLISHDRNARNAALPLSPEVRCIHTEVSSVDTYFQNEPSSGAVVRFFGRVHDPYQGTLPPELVQRGYSSLTQVRRGDRVQVCLIDVPRIERTSRCSPAHDPRGRWYRAFDYRLRRAFTAPNANHGCGGA